MSYYIPKPWHLLTISAPIFALGVLALNSEIWTPFGWIMIALGFISTALITLASIWTNVISHLDAKRYLMDSAKHLDIERLAALGMVVGEPKQTVDLRITTTDKNGAMEKIQIINGLPISPVKMQAVANAMMGGSPFSRPELVERRHLLTDGEYRKLKDAFEKRGLIAQKSAGNPNAGYEPTLVGWRIIEKFTLPSPTPTLDDA